MVSPPLPKQRGSTVRAKPDASSGADIVDTPIQESPNNPANNIMLPRQVMILSMKKSVGVHEQREATMAVCLTHRHRGRRNLRALLRLRA
jgi:hypothetical protein